ncbi:TPA: M48 family metallopeptidase [Candidatus Woesearchaeota archaeon]|nr:M48 family metallopeptidase [Candidatus Woesearchaeota archaeon]
MTLIHESFTRLFPQKEFTYIPELEYNRRLSSFNANIKLHGKKLKVCLNLQWKDIDDEIKIGLIQHLLLKIFRRKSNPTTTTNIDLYNNFTRNIHLVIPKTKCDPLLAASFERMNTRFLGGSLEKPNLQWGADSRRKLAHYNFHNDTITMSTLFKESSQEILDYIMYHEMLHKHFKFEHNNGRSSFHSPAFRQAERMYPNWKEIENKIHSVIRSTPRKRVQKKVKKGLWRFFG